VRLHKISAHTRLKKDYHEIVCNHVKGGVFMKLNVKKVEKVAPAGDNPWG